MEISDTTVSVFYASKLLALAPYSVRKNSKGVYEIRRSIIFSIYSTALTITMVCLTYQGLLFDANSEIPVRMKSATSKVVTALDVSVVVFSATAGVFCGLFGVKATRELNTRLQKIDHTQHSLSNLNRDRIRAIAMTILSLSTIVILLALDVWTWLRLASEMRIKLNVRWYIPFYSMYLILTGLQVNFANTTYGVGRRYSRLNKMLRSNFLNEKSDAAAKPPKITSVKTISFSTATPFSLHSSLTKLNTETLPNESQSKHKIMLIKVLAENHESLGKCVLLISSSYGITVLLILVSCLLHLVATAYFLFLEILNKKDNGFKWLQVLWLCFHTLRLLMVVEPCHLSGRESRKTSQIVCEIIRSTHEPILAVEVKKFWQQLVGAHMDFSANGLCRVNRTILTSFASAIATYLVILIQFQKTNG